MAGEDTVVQQSLTEQTYKIIKNKILRKELEPGSRLNDDKIALELGISTTPIRLALDRLKNEGLVQIKPRSGTYVREFQSKDIWELFSIREALESLALQRSWGKHPVNRLRSLQSRTEEAREMIAGNRDTSLAIETDYQFHRMLLDKCDNGLLSEMLEGIITLSHYFMQNEFENDHDYANTCSQHIGIIKCMIEGDYASAQKMLKFHIKNTGERLEESYRQQEAEATSP